MQRILFTLLSVGIAVLLGTGQAPAESDAGAASGSCSGDVDGWGHLHAHTHEHGYVIDGDIVTEDHDFDFGGFLQGAQNARFLRMRDERWAIFRAGDFDLAVPFIEGAGLCSPGTTRTPTTTGSSSAATEPDGFGRVGPRRVGTGWARSRELIAPRSE